MDFDSIEHPLAKLRKFMILPVLAYGYVIIFIYVSIIVFVLILVSGGWFTGYWNFNRKKASAYNKLIDDRDKRKETLRLRTADK